MGAHVNDYTHGNPAANSTLRNMIRNLDGKIASGQIKTNDPTSLKRELLQINRVVKRFETTTPNPGAGTQNYAHGGVAGAVPGQRTGYGYNNPHSAGQMNPAPGIGPKAAEHLNQEIKQLGKTFHIDPGNFG